MVWLIRERRLSWRIEGAFDQARYRADLFAHPILYREVKSVKTKRERYYRSSRDRR